jgi:hypothetical protein
MFWARGGEKKAQSGRLIFLMRQQSLKEFFGVPETMKLGTA